MYRMCTKCVLCLWFKSLIFRVVTHPLPQKNSKEYLEFMLAEFLTIIFYNAAVSKKKSLSWTKYHSFPWGHQNVDDSLICTGNICYFTTKKTARWCFGMRHIIVPFLLFPSNYCWQGGSKIFYKFLGFHTFVCCSSFLRMNKNRVHEHSAIHM